MGLFSFIGGLLGSGGQKKAADQAAKLQYDAAMKGIAETGRQFDITRSDFAPAQALLAPSAEHLGNLTGINGDEALRTEIEALKAGPLYNSLYGNGRDAILANAAATGGLRGGNVEDALARFSGDTLNNVISGQLANYGGMIGIGTGAAGAVGNFGANAVSQSNALRGQGADALGQAALVKAGINAQNWNNAGSLASSMSDLLPSKGIFNTLKKIF